MLVESAQSPPGSKAWTPPCSWVNKIFRGLLVYNGFRPVAARVTDPDPDLGILVDLDLGILVGSGSGYLGWIWIWVFGSGPDLGIWVGSGSRYLGRIRIVVFWSDPDLGILVGSRSEYFGRIQIWISGSDPAAGIWVGSGSGLNIQIPLKPIFLSMFVDQIYKKVREAAKKNLVARKREKKNLKLKKIILKKIWPQSLIY